MHTDTFPSSANHSGPYRHPICAAAFAVRHDSPRAGREERLAEPLARAGKQPVSAAHRAKGTRGTSSLQYLSFTPREAEDFNETPSPLAPALSLQNNYLQVLEGFTRNQPKKSPNQILTRELQLSVLLGSCGFQPPSQTQGAYFPEQLKTQRTYLFPFQTVKLEFN